MLGSRFFSKSRHLFGTPFLRMNPNTILRMSSTSSLYSSTSKIDKGVRQIDIQTLSDNSVFIKRNEAGSCTLSEELEKEDLVIEELLNRDIECLWDIRGTVGKIVALEETKMNRIVMCEELII